MMFDVLTRSTSHGVSLSNGRLVGPNLETYKVFSVDFSSFLSHGQSSITPFLPNYFGNVF